MTIEARERAVAHGFIVDDGCLMPANVTQHNQEIAKEIAYQHGYTVMGPSYISALLDELHFPSWVSDPEFEEYIRDYIIVPALENDDEFLAFFEYSY